MVDVSPSSALLSTQWLHDNLDNPTLRIVDVRWHSRIENGRGVSFDDHDAYARSHVPGAVFAGMAGELSDPDHPVPDMLAPPERFANVMGRLGVGAETLVVAYDAMGPPLGSARLRWALRYCGHERVRVLDGGFLQWLTEGRPVSPDIAIVEPATFTPKPRAGFIANKQDVVEAMGREDTVIVECLIAEQYNSKNESDVWGNRGGHIPGAVNVPFFSYIDPALAHASAAERDRLRAEGRPFVLASPDILAEAYGTVGVGGEKRVVAYCGRGYSAALGLLALNVPRHVDVRLYDGSWAEWSADTSLPVESGPDADG